jgi:hypothetical protein
MPRRTQGAVRVHSDRSSELGERVGDAPIGWVHQTRVRSGLAECSASARDPHDHSRQVVTLESAHRSGARLEPDKVGFDPMFAYCAVSSNPPGRSSSTTASKVLADRSRPRPDRHACQGPSRQNVARSASSGLEAHGGVTTPHSAASDANRRSPSARRRRKPRRLDGAFSHSGVRHGGGSERGQMPVPDARQGGDAMMPEWRLNMSVPETRSAAC